MRDNAKTRCNCFGSCQSVNRRTFIKAVGLGSAAMTVGLPVVAGPFAPGEFEKLVPADKKLARDWLDSLFARGAPTIYRGSELDYIGMPIGGICTGQVYLGGDGRLWHWDIFNHHNHTGESHYATPLKANSPLAQGFALRVNAGDRSDVRTFDREGFAEITFRGEYPIGLVRYHDPNCPVEVSLEAFSPFIPLNPLDSHLPATILRFTLKNSSAAKVECDLAGWLENAVCLHSGIRLAGVRKNAVMRSARAIALNCTAATASSTVRAERPPIIFADFDSENYGQWTVQGEAFGPGPAKGAWNEHQILSGFQGKGVVNSWRGDDKLKGKLTSPPFTIHRNYISFLIAGGQHAGRTCVNLLVDGQIVRTATGKNSDTMEWVDWYVRDLAGQTAQLEIIDDEASAWGHIDVDQIEFRDTPRVPGGPLEAQEDFGSMALVLLEPQSGDSATAIIPEKVSPQGIFDALAAGGQSTASQELPDRLLGAVGRHVSLSPGQETSVTFIVAWYFPNIQHLRLPNIEGRRYGKRFESAGAVAEYIAENFEELARQTRLWRDTWYDSTLPYWFLDRTFANTSILATSTCYWFGNERFYGWEGVGCCEGTCTHVWQYAQAVARLFPTLERETRRQVDFGSALQTDGSIYFRAEFNNFPAVDGQAGTILRALREHQMSPDDAFLTQNWPAIRKAIQWLMAKDGDGDGLITGNQHNTLDADWYGPVAWLSGLYQAALCAGAVMATEVGDREFAETCQKILEVGKQKLTAELFNGEYYINKPDPKHLDAINSGSGCHIDQVMGQGWAFQVASDRVLPKTETVAALKALWRYNFTPDIGPYRRKYEPGRWYAMPGEGGLLMCTFPRDDWDYKQASGKGPDWAARYFNECMSGFEYQVAGHMIWEGMVQEGLAVARMIHDRYHASRRNPWNEIECGDHYARAMASYGVFLAACGYEYHGPKGYLAFAPRLTPDNFRAAFTAAEGWGTFSQRCEAGKQNDTIEVKWGRLRLRSLAFALPEGAKPTQVAVTVDGKSIGSSLTTADGRVHITLDAETLLTAGQKIEIAL